MNDLDEFAARAMQGLVSKYGAGEDQMTAELAYDMAEAMMKEREIRKIVASIEESCGESRDNHRTEGNQDHRKFPFTRRDIPDQGDSK